MNRQFNNRTIELLAPVKTFEDFEKTIHSRADAVYFGGKKFNMRVHNSAYNLTDEEIAKATRIAHDLGKKVYITFNNMMSDAELKEAESYLRFLEKVRPDALIIQDLGAVKLIKDLGLDLELHLSVMSNVHNEQMIAAALELGITRVVLSREVHLHEITRFVDQYPEMEYEYFTHGDMCTVHGAQCYYSGTLFGNSSNRGKCMKPCRWKFAPGSGDLDHPLAAKDLSLYRHLPQLISSGVNSFKIEGRMRDVNYMISVINLYAEAIDRFLEDPTGYATDENAVATLQENRIRNISTAYAFKKPGIVNIDPGGREPRVFSQPTLERDIHDSKVEKIKEKLTGGSFTTVPDIAITVNTLDAFKSAVDSKANIVYLSGEVYRPTKPFSLAKIKEACEYAASHHTKVYYALPRMLNERQFLALDRLIPKLKEFGVTGLLVNNLGQVHHFRACGLELIGDYGMNVYNQHAAEFYNERGVTRTTLSIEAPPQVVKDFLHKNQTRSEIIVQGAPTLMYMEHCLKAAEYGITSDDWCEDYCLKESMDLRDEKGFVRRVRADQFCKNHVLPMKDFCYVPILDELAQNGVDVIRIEAKDYTPEQIKKLVKFYHELLSQVSEAFNWQKSVCKIEAITGLKQSLHSLNHLK
jgi:putative protease